MNKLISIKEREGTISKLNSLLGNKKVHGVSYSNSYLNKRYLCRASVLDKDISVEQGKVSLTLPTRVEAAGLGEIEETLEMLLRYGAGAMPGFTPERAWEEQYVEIVSPTQMMMTIDITVKMEFPTITYKDFSIAGSKFTLVELTRSYDDDAFNQTITLLFGESDKLYLLSHFYGKELNVRDMKMILDLIVEDNLTGKLIRSIMLEVGNGTSSAIFPFERAITSYLNDDNEYTFGDGAGAITIPLDNLKDYKMTCEPNGVGGSYMIHMEATNHTISFMLE